MTLEPTWEPDDFIYYYNDDLGSTECPDVPADNGLIVGEDGLARPPWAADNPLLRDYYDTEWGMPVRDEQGLYERICLEGFQAGLSWLLVLRKREALRAAFAGFDPDVVATFTEADIERLAQDPALIRNPRKLGAAVKNARATIALRDQGGLAELVWSFQPEETPRPLNVSEIPSSSQESAALAKALKKAGFTFVGPTTMFALMEAIGMVDTHVVGSHRRGSSGVWPE